MNYDATFEWDELGNRPCLLAKAWTRSATAAEDHARAMASVIRAAKRAKAADRAFHITNEALAKVPDMSDADAHATPEWARYQAAMTSLVRAGKSLDVAVTRLEKLERKK